MGGLWAKLPKMGGMALLFVMASLGLPGLGNFIAEIMILIGAFFANKAFAIVAALGFISATIYSLRIMQKVFYGKEQKQWQISDLNIREMSIMISLAVVIIWLGLFPNSILKLSAKPVQKVIEKANRAGIAKCEQIDMHRRDVNSLAITYSH